MLRLTQIYNMIPKKDSKNFAMIFDDLSFEIEELGYQGMESELVSDILFNHFGLEFTCEDQLESFTADILKYQGQMVEKCKALDILLGRY